MEKIQLQTTTDGLKIAYIDVCHNISGLKTVISEIKQNEPGKKIRVACAFSKLKDISCMIKFLLSNVDTINFLAVSHFKLETVSNLYQQAQEAFTEVEDQPDIGKLAPLIAGGELTETLTHVVAESKSDEVLLVCGSFFIMEDVRNFFFKDECIEHDPSSVNK